MLLDGVDVLSAKVKRLTACIDELVGGIPVAAAPPASPGSAAVPGLAVLTRLDEIAGVGMVAARVIVAEVGLNMAQFPTANHLVPWARISPGLSSEAQDPLGQDRQG